MVNFMYSNDGTIDLHLPSPSEIHTMKFTLLQYAYYEVYFASILLLEAKNPPQIDILHSVDRY